ncbi:efflux RND transporter periplasmic adaptor subunit [Hephaestia sp. GCM10023244]|uniref:efflux RND transporter periplasmic adaptor subunit n=1 Tax=unclassified Hephaestia TaxID=2631281 RepID=UPI00207746FB|nr:efflux RND transporter periplasmic adaptor subunit [Hephaestia sp. MAHUQ-44]MCM8732527.1 efflux RND transporter periplasmic adaptor subunit [Hephaestia sp. MAHUQ-44]
MAALTRLTVFAPLLLVTACSGGADQPDNTVAPVAPVALVALGTVEQGPVTSTVNLYGAVEAGPSGTLTLTSPAEAIVSRIVTPVGTHVGEGQAVVLLTPSPTTRVDFAKAASDAVAADKALARAQRLRGDGLASDADVEAARAAAQSADALARSMRARAGGLTLRAPAAGVVQAIANRVGDLAPAGTSVATIARLDDLRAHFGVDPDVARDIRVGTPIHITASDGGAPIEVAVQSIDPVVDPQTRLASIYARLPDNAGLAAGETLSGAIDTGSGGKALTAPYAALLDDGGQPYVFVVAGGVAHRHDVQAGATSGDRIVIAKGVKPGDKVVTQGGTALEDGMKVRIR